MDRQTRDDIAEWLVESLLASSKARLKRENVLDSWEKKNIFSEMKDKHNVTYVVGRLVLFCTLVLVFITNSFQLSIPLRQ